MDLYSTHLPILEKLTNFIHTKEISVFEYGMGNYSTPHFINNYKKVLSIETQDKKWFDDISTKFKNDNFACLFELCHGQQRECINEKSQIQALEIYKELNKISKFQLVFVDGCGSFRWRCVNEAFKYADIIIAHDTEEPGYQWNKIENRDDFIRIDFKKYTPWTTIWIKIEIDQTICKPFLIELVKLYKEL